MSRRVRLLVWVASLSLALAPLLSTGGQLDAAETSPLTIPPGAEGWWWALSERPTRDTPLGALVPAPATPSPDVPEGAIPVSVRGGRVDKVAAVGVELDPEVSGGTASTATLTLKEVDSGTAHFNADSAGIVACPITDFFVPTVKGELSKAPTADCEIGKAEGTRNDDGTWTFDIAPIVTAWLDGTVSANGLRFDPLADSGASFQVAFTGVEDAVLAVDITPPEGGSEDPFDLGGAPTGDFGGGSGGSSGGGDFSAPVTDLPEPADTPEVPSGSPTDESPRVAAPAASRAGDTVGNWPVGVLLAALAAVAVAVFAGWSLGQTEPVEATTRRQRGVARALAARTSTRST